MTIQEAIRSGLPFKRPSTMPRYWWWENWIIYNKIASSNQKKEDILSSDWEVLICDKHEYSVSEVSLIGIPCEECTREWNDVQAKQYFIETDTEEQETCPCYIGKDEECGICYPDNINAPGYEERMGLDTEISPYECLGCGDDFIPSHGQDLKCPQCVNLALNEMEDCGNPDCLDCTLVRENENGGDQFPALPPGKSNCECGAEKTYGINATHAHWCPKGN